MIRALIDVTVSVFTVKLKIIRAVIHCGYDLGVCVYGLSVGRIYECLGFILLISGSMKCIINGLYNLKGLLQCFITGRRKEEAKTQSDLSKTESGQEHRKRGQVRKERQE